MPHHRNPRSGARDLVAGHRSHAQRPLVPVDALTQPVPHAGFLEQGSHEGGAPVPLPPRHSTSTPSRARLDRPDRQAVRTRRAGRALPRSAPPAHDPNRAYRAAQADAADAGDAALVPEARDARPAGDVLDCATHPACARRSRRFRPRPRCPPWPRSVRLRSRPCRARAHRSARHRAACLGPLHAPAARRERRGLARRDR